MSGRRVVAHGPCAPRSRRPQRRCPPCAPSAAALRRFNARAKAAGGARQSCPGVPVPLSADSRAIRPGARAVRAAAGGAAGGPGRVDGRTDGAVAAAGQSRNAGGTTAFVIPAQAGIHPSRLPRSFPRKPVLAEAGTGIHPSRERGRPARKRFARTLPDFAMRAGRPRSQDAPVPAASGSGRPERHDGGATGKRTPSLVPRGENTPIRTSTRGFAPGPHKR